MAAGQGQTTPRGQHFDVTCCHFGNLLQVQRKSLWSLILYTILYTFFYDFIHIYSTGAGSDNPLGTKFWCQPEHLATSVICCKFKRKSLWSLILYNFFMIFYMYLAPGQGQTAPRGQSLHKRHFVHLLQVSKRCFWSLILYTFFSWFNTCI